MSDGRHAVRITPWLDAVLAQGLDARGVRQVRKALGRRSQHVFLDEFDQALADVGALVARLVGLGTRRAFVVVPDAATDLAAAAVRLTRPGLPDLALTPSARRVLDERGATVEQVTWALSRAAEPVVPDLDLLGAATDLSAALADGTQVVTWHPAWRRRLAEVDALLHREVQRSSLPPEHPRAARRLHRAGTAAAELASEPAWQQVGEAGIVVATRLHRGAVRAQVVAANARGLPDRQFAAPGGAGSR